MMMPMGFEFGGSAALDPVATRPSDWQARDRGRPSRPAEFIAAANALKARDADVLNLPGRSGGSRRQTAASSGSCGWTRARRLPPTSRVCSWSTPISRIPTGLTPARC